MNNENRYDAIAVIFRNSMKRFDTRSLTKLAYLKFAVLVFAELISSYRTLKMSQSKYEQDLTRSYLNNLILSSKALFNKFMIFLKLPVISSLKN
jgi:hypothetical protein